jgi:hypothetical protein
VNHFVLAAVVNGKSSWGALGVCFASIASSFEERGWVLFAVHDACFCGLFMMQQDGASKHVF